MLANIFYTCSSVYPTYGKDPDQFKRALGAFRMALADFMIEDIKKAFTCWIRSKNSFPTPSDIVSIIERGGRPAFEKTIYVKLETKRKENPTLLTSDEWQYIRDYEHFMITGKY